MHGCLAEAKTERKTEREKKGRARDRGRAFHSRDMRCWMESLQFQARRHVLALFRFCQIYFKGPNHCLGSIGDNGEANVLNK